MAKIKKKVARKIVRRIVRKAVPPPSEPTTAGLIEYFSDLGSKPVNWAFVLGEWLKIRPFSTGLADMPFWAGVALVVADQSKPTSKKTAPSGFIWM